MDEVMDRLTHAIQLAEGADKDEVPSGSGSGSGDPLASGRIELRDVELSYPTRPSAPILKGVNMTIEDGQTVAVVGGSGCGKSTLLHLLQKNYPISRGTITVGGKDLRHINTPSYRSQMATVPQEPKLFNRSVAENIAYRPSAASPPDLVEVGAAAQAANADGFISELQGAYGYEVGKFGEKLSGGQRQRVSIARSLFADDKVKMLFLDEATSALDNESEHLVQVALETAQKGRTTLIVAHRLSTIMQADCIFVMKGGRVVEQGTFDELKAKPDGEFASHYAGQL